MRVRSFNPKAKTAGRPVVWSLVAMKKARRSAAAGNNSRKSETRISAIADFVRECKQEKKRFRYPRAVCLGSLQTRRNQNKLLDPLG